MPSVSEVPPPKPVLPDIPARLLSSASAPSLAASSAADPGYRECLAALAVVSAETNPEDDPGYRESWDAYWARVRLQRNRPYVKAYQSTSPPKREKGIPFQFLLSFHGFELRVEGKGVLCQRESSCCFCLFLISCFFCFICFVCFLISWFCLFFD